MQFQAVSRYLYPSRVAGSEWMELNVGSLVALSVPNWLPSVCRAFQNARKPVTAAVQTVTLSARRCIWKCDLSKSLKEQVLPTPTSAPMNQSPDPGSGWSCFELESCTTSFERMGPALLSNLWAHSWEKVDGNLLFINLSKVLGKLLGLWLRGN